MHLGRVCGVATGAYFSQVSPCYFICKLQFLPTQGSNAGQTLNTRLPMPGQTANSCKNMVDLQPLFIVDAGGKIIFISYILIFRFSSHVLKTDAIYKFINCIPPLKTLKV